jgi:hypothetical protein
MRPARANRHALGGAKNINMFYPVAYTSADSFNRAKYQDLDDLCSCMLVRMTPLTEHRS